MQQSDHNDDAPRTKRTLGTLLRWFTYHSLPMGFGINIRFDVILGLTYRLFPGFMSELML